jgi:hypothetical protein
MFLLLSHVISRYSSIPPGGKPPSSSGSEALVHVRPREISIVQDTYSRSLFSISANPRHIVIVFPTVTSDSDLPGVVSDRCFSQILTRNHKRSSIEPRCVKPYGFGSCLPRSKGNIRKVRGSALTRTRSANWTFFLLKHQIMASAASKIRHRSNAKFFKVSMCCMEAR